ncbi:hypothetical protein [Pedobacter foliorum]|uniref:hypothetical protein n=1 Tax=Pedobacter foliorum TaxID=2739058 RepID=UPI001563E1AD|nr:hypothetical protein [Pedobacter foliorum]NRF37623.1 hypothetical protein [Pedobacter foliorum]
MEDFNASEKYRKYLIELDFNHLTVLTVWGTDMVDGEDKLLVNGEKLIVLKTAVDIKSVLQKLENPYLDQENYRQWIEEENLHDIYNVNDMKLLSKFEFSFLEEKSTALIVLNDINLIQDFAIQVDHSKLLPIFDQSAMVNLKDFIYDNHFWKGGDKNSVALKKEEMEIIALCKRLYTVFFDSISFV